MKKMKNKNVRNKLMKKIKKYNFPLVHINRELEKIINLKKKSFKKVNNDEEQKKNLIFSTVFVQK